MQKQPFALQMLFKIGAFKNFAILTGKHLYWSFFLLKINKLQQKETPTMVFSCKYRETLSEQVFLQITSGGCFWVKQSIKDILRNIYFKIPRTTCCIIQIRWSMFRNYNRNPSAVFLAIFQNSCFREQLLGNASEKKIEEEEDVK